MPKLKDIVPTFNILEPSDRLKEGEKLLPKSEPLPLCIKKHSSLEEKIACPNSHKQISSSDPYDFINCRTRITETFYMSDVLAAIYAAQGNFLEISLLLNKRRTSVKDYILAHLETKDAYDEVLEIKLDKVEQVLYEIAVEERDPTSLRFLASTLGKDRGYSPRVEATGKDGQPLSLEVNFSGDNPASNPVLEQSKREEIMKELLDKGFEKPIEDEKKEEKTLS